jgi:DNA-binding SARP family transcriptional activator/TolB-like protein
MYFLRILGGAALDGPAGPLNGRATQRRRLALLALLATAPGRALSRDKLIGYLWPEHDTEQARRLLTVSLYEIRRAIGEQVLRTCGDEVVLSLADMVVDAVDFREAIRNGEWQRAVSLYTGPFLDGFFVADAPELERWVDAEREHLGRRFREALERTAEEQAASGELRGAVESWRRLAAEDRFNGRVALGLMRVLEAAGDKAGAIQHARVHSALLREELGAEPDTEVEAMADRLRSDASPPPLRPVAAVLGPAPEPAVTAGTATPASPLTAVLPADPPVSAAEYRYPTRVHARFWLMAGMFLLLLLGVGATSSAWQRQKADTGISPRRVAVLPFHVHGSTNYGYLEAGMVDLLSINLDGAGDLRVVDPRALQSFIATQRMPVTDPRHARAVAVRFGAGLYVTGTVSEVAGRLRIMARLHEVGRDDQPAAQAMVEGGSEDLFSMVDLLTSRLLAERFAAPAYRLDRVAVAATSSLPALKSYLEGEQAFRAGQFGPAIEAFQRAISHDSTFALAYYRLSVAGEWGARRDLMRPAAETALRLADRLPLRDRQLLEAFLAWQRGDADEAERRYGDILDFYRDDIEARFQLAEVLFHYNAFRGRPTSESRDTWERVLDLAPDNRFALIHLARLDSFEGAHASLDRRWRRIRELDPADDLRVVEMSALRALAIGSSLEERRAAERIRRLDGEELMQMVSYLAAFSQNLAGVRRTAMVMLEPARSPATRFVGHLEVGYLDLAMGRWTSARKEFDAAARIDRASATLHAALLACHPGTPATPEELIELRTRVERLGAAAPANFLGVNTATPEFYPVARDYLLGLLSVRLDDLAAADRYASLLDGVADPLWVAASARDMARGLRARMMEHEGDLEGALHELERVRLDETPYNVARNSPFRGRGAERFLHAEMLNRLGRDEEALRWYASLGATSYQETIYLAPSHMRRAEIHERRGEIEDARAHYSRVVELWSGADSELQPEVTRAHEALQRVGHVPVRRRDGLGAARGE